MLNKYHKKSKIWLIGPLIIIITISLVGLNSCASKKSINIKAVNVNIENNQNSLAVDGLPITIEKVSFTKYLSLLGLNKKELISALNEEPNIIDEGGLEFKKAEIRVWFDTKSYTLVDQIFIMGKDIDFNGVKINDNINGFKKVFGNPLSDKNGDAHFKYKNIFLSVNYDINTKQTYGVYILKNNF